MAVSSRLPSSARNAIPTVKPTIDFWPIPFIYQFLSFSIIFDNNCFHHRQRSNKPELEQQDEYNNHTGSRRGAASNGIYPRHTPCRAAGNWGTAVRGNYSGCCGKDC
uniref:Uncharacterized protein n=1 Tax=Entomoneis paludosa TaxID=265537 RepID=A0A7S2YTX6_9STRA